MTLKRSNGTFPPSKYVLIVDKPSLLCYNQYVGEFCQEKNAPFGNIIIRGKTMSWFNIYGLIYVAVIMIPNIIFAMKCKDGFENKWQNKAVEIIEQIGRFGCFGFMIFSIPGTVFGWWFEGAFTLYLIVDSILVAAYCAIWAICFKKSSVFRALALSIIPSVLFLFSGIVTGSVLLTITAVLFAPSHIMISYKNAK